MALGSRSASLLLLLVALGASGCMRARLLNPVTNTTTSGRIDDSTPGGFSTGGGTLKGQGVTLQASFSMAQGSPLKAHGVQLQTGP